MSFSYLISSKYVGDECWVAILRDGQPLKGKFRLGTRHELVKSHMFMTKPSYFIYAGLCFTTLTCPFLVAEYGEKWDKKAPIDLCDKAFYGVQKKEGQEVHTLGAGVGEKWRELNNECAHVLT